MCEIFPNKKLCVCLDVVYSTTNWRKIWWFCPYVKPLTEVTSIVTASLSIRMTVFDVNYQDNLLQKLFKTFYRTMYNNFFFFCKIMTKHNK